MVVADLDALALELDEHMRDPERFARTMLDVHIYPHQAAILQALARAARGDGKRRIAVRSCNSIGKDFLAGLSTLWWPSQHDDAGVVTTGPTGHQVFGIIWHREIHGLYQQAKIPLGGRLLDTEWKITPRQWAVALSTITKEALQGRHAELLLVIIDEASAREISEETWQAAESLMASGQAVLLALGNPTRNEGAFARAFGEERELWDCHHISAFDTPNLQACARMDGFEGLSYDNWREWKPQHVASLKTCPIVQPGLVTHEWVEDQRTLHGEESDFWQVHALGDFPSAGTNQVVPLSWVELASRYRHRLASRRRD